MCRFRVYFGLSQLIILSTKTNNMKITIVLMLSILFCQEPKKQNKQYRDAGSGQYITKKHAEYHKSTTVSISRKKR